MDVDKQLSSKTIKRIPSSGTDAQNLPLSENAAREVTESEAYHDTYDIMSLGPALDSLEPSEGGENDRITALPAFPTNSWQQAIAQREREKFRKARSVMM